MTTGPSINKASGNAIVPTAASWTSASAMRPITAMMSGNSIAMQIHERASGNHNRKIRPVVTESGASA